MRILLIYPNIIEVPKDISLGLASVAAILKQYNHLVELIDTTFGKTDEEIKEQIKNFQPEFVCITLATNDFKYGLHIINLIKKEYLNIPVLAGGYHPTMAPLEVLENEFIDMVCIGEGDLPIRDVANMLENKKTKTNIKNIWFKTKDGKIIKNPQRNLPNLDELPIPDRTIYDYQKYIDWHNGTATFISTRGCPYPCTYCINRVQKGIYKNKGSFVRYKSVDKIIAEIKSIINKYKIKEIGFNDDIFTLDHKRTKEFCLKYKEIIGDIPFYINTRVNTVTKELFSYLAKSGCKRVNIGVETGDIKVRNEILERNMTDEGIIKTFQWAKEEGIETYSFNMVGIPFETKESIQKTIELNKKLNPTYVGCSIFTAFPGTPIYELCKKNNWLKEGYSSSYFQDTNIVHPNFTPKELKKIRDSFGFQVYKNTRPLRAYIDLIDKKLIKFAFYIKIRSFGIKMRTKYLLTKKKNIT